MLPVSLRASGFALLMSQQCFFLFFFEAVLCVATRTAAVVLCGAAYFSALILANRRLSGIVG